MSMRAKGSRHIATLRQDREQPWRWLALMYGHAHPVRFCLGPGSWRRRYFRFHLTPIHVERWANQIEVGLCLGRRTLYLLRHR